MRGPADLVYWKLGNREGTFTKPGQKALSVAVTAQEHKALNLRVLRVSRQVDYADFFVLMSATSSRHAQSLADSIVKDLGLKSQTIEGYARGEWVLLDLKDVIVHIFFEPVRAYYNFDKLWADAPAVNLARLAGRPRKASAPRPRA